MSLRVLHHLLEADEMHRAKPRYGLPLLNYRLSLLRDLFNNLVSKYRADPLLLLYRVQLCKLPPNYLQTKRTSSSRECRKCNSNKALLS